MKEGGTEAPIRHPIPWSDPAFYDGDELDTELRRVFDICHGCRRCFNLCDSFPRLFDLIDESETGELDSVASADFKPVVDACTLCDMCFMTKCPYVPPHEFDLDFPHLMLRYRAAERHRSGGDFRQRQISQTDRNGRLAGAIAGLANWASRTSNSLTRPVLEKIAGIHREAHLPRYHSKAFARQAAVEKLAINREAPAVGRKAVLFATCFVNFNNPRIGGAARRVLAHNGVETEVVYPTCCGMPQLEQGDIESVAAQARSATAELVDWIDRGYDVLALIPSCALMLKFEWPLILPGDPAVARVSQATSDITEYIVDIARNEGLAEGLKPLASGVALHLACHARAQNMGAKAADLLDFIPDADITVIERCSGHGGSWGVMRKNFEVGIKVGRPVAHRVFESEAYYVASECPLAADHIVQGMSFLSETEIKAETRHPIELIAQSYGLKA